VQVLLDTFRDVVNKVLKKTRITAAQVKAIGITTQRASFLLWNKYVPPPSPPTLMDDASRA
jgi:glycerol kinase